MHIILLPVSLITIYLTILLIGGVALTALLLVLRHLLKEAVYNRSELDEVI